MKTTQLHADGKICLDNRGDRSAVSDNNQRPDNAQIVSQQFLDCIRLSKSRNWNDLLTVASAGLSWKTQVQRFMNKKSLGLNRPSLYSCP